MHENAQVDNFLESLKFLSSTFFQEPHNPEVIGHFFQSAQAEERAILPDEIDDEDRKKLGQTINYMMMLTKDQAERYQPIRLWLGKVMMRLGVQERD